MSESSVQNDRGQATHIRVTTPDGTQSRLYEVSYGLWDNKGPCVEVTDHHADGTSSSYEYDAGIFDDRGAPK